MQRRFLLKLLSLLFVILLAPQSFADVIVSFGALTPDPISVGGFGTLDVFARTDVGTESLDGFNFSYS